jgi:hypothetical protein
MDGIWDVLHFYWKKYWSKHGISLSAQNKLEYLCNLIVGNILNSSS